MISAVFPHGHPLSKAVSSKRGAVRLMQDIFDRRSKGTQAPFEKRKRGQREVFVVSKRLQGAVDLLEQVCSTINSYPHGPCTPLNVLFFKFLGLYSIHAPSSPERFWKEQRRTKARSSFISTVPSRRISSKEVHRTRHW